MAAIVPGPANQTYYPDEVLGRQYRLADQLRNVPQARSFAGVLAQGLGAFGGNLVQGSANNAAQSNQDMRSADIGAASNATDLPSMSKVLLGSKVPELQTYGLKTKIQQLGDDPNKQYRVRAAQAQQYGLNPGSPEFRNFVLTGSLPAARDPLDTEIKRLQIEALKNKPVAPPEIKEFYDEHGRKIKAQWDGQKWIPVFGAAAASDDSTYGKEQTKYDVKRVGGLQDKSNDAEGTLSDLNELEAARAQTSTEGPWLNMLPNVSAGAQRVQSAATNIMLSFTSKTKGAISDRENENFMKATPGMGMSDEAAKPVIDGMRLAARRVQEKASFFDTWLRTNRNLDGAQQAWNKFVNDKPILKETSDGKYILQPQNVDDWRGYLKGGPQQNAETAPTAPVDSNTLLNDARDAINRGAPRDAVIKELQSRGVDTSGL